MATDDADEIEIDYDWHPREDEFVSPLGADEWQELLGDEDFQSTDEYRAIVCLREYGAPATFQQLSIRYRAAMGRYRRWLAEAARIAGERFGVAEAPSHDQFGLDEWWPLLYQTRATGKPGAGIFEMQLRPEVEEAFVRLAEAERQAKRAENARQLQRIEQLERARQAERARAAERTRAAEQARASEAEATRAAAADDAPKVASAPEGERKPRTAPERPKRVAAPAPTPAAPVPAASEVTGALPALVSFLTLMEREGDVASGGEVQEIDATAPLDYALRYAERLRHAITLMRQVRPRITVASLARALGDESVAALQSYLNGQEVPSFAYLDRLQEHFLISSDYLEAAEPMAETMPVFRSLVEAFGPEGVAERIVRGPVEEICYVVDDTPERRTGVVVVTGMLCSGLITRYPVQGSAHRSESEQLSSFIAMVDELDAYASEVGIRRTSLQASAKIWEALAAGSIWPQAVLA